MDCFIEMKFYASERLVGSFMCYQSQWIRFCFIIIALRYDNPNSSKRDG